MTAQQDLIEQIQDDLITILDELVDQETMDNVCLVIVDRFAQRGK